MPDPVPTVRARVTAFLGLPDGRELRVESGGEYPVDDPMVIGWPDLFAAPPDAPPVPEAVETVGEPPVSQPADPLVDGAPVDEVAGETPAEPFRRPRRQAQTGGQADG